MLILGLLGMYFDAVVVFVTSQTLLFRLALAILCRALGPESKSKSLKNYYLMLFQLKLVILESRRNIC